MEFKFINDVAQMPGITFNYDEIKESIGSSLAKYSDEVTEATFRDAKSDRAKINKMIAFLKEKKTDVKARLLAPMEGFADKIDALVAMCSNTVVAIDDGIKKIEAERKQKKLEWYTQYLADRVVSAGIFDPIAVSALREWVVSNTRWLNATFDSKDAEREIDAKVQEHVRGIETIKATFEDGKLFAIAISEFAKTLDLGLAISKTNEIKRTVAEAEAAASTPPTMASAPAVSAPVANVASVSEKQKKKRYEVSIAVTGTIEQLNALKKFIADSGMGMTQLTKAVEVK